MSLSTTEAEFIAAAQASRELLGLRKLSQELCIKIAEPMKMKMENQAAIKQLESEKGLTSAKHVEDSFQVYLPLRSGQVVQPIFLKFGEMIADLLTKALPTPRIAELRDMFSLKIMHSTGDEEC